MPTRTTVWTNPAWHEWIREHAHEYNWGNGGEKNRTALYDAFIKRFGKLTPATPESLRLFAKWVKIGGQYIPSSQQRRFDEQVLQVSSEKAVLVTSDWHIDFHDAEWAAFAFEMGSAFGCDAHAIVGDFVDMASLSKFDTEARKAKPDIEDELLPSEAILTESVKRFGLTYLVLGNHEWRFWRRLLQAAIAPERFQRLFSTDDKVRLSEFSYMEIRAGSRLVRCTHPKNYSQVAGSVGGRLAEKYRSDVIVAHDHRVAHVRDRSGSYTVIHSGMMADRRRLPYLNTVDSTNPETNQGFCIVTPQQTLLFDAENCDREWWLRQARSGRVG